MRENEKRAAAFLDNIETFCQDGSSRYVFIELHEKQVRTNYYNPIYKISFINVETLFRNARIFYKENSIGYGS